jgi:hypothetical protein
LSRLASVQVEFAAISAFCAHFKFGTEQEIGHAWQDQFKTKKNPVWHVASGV